MTKFKVGDEVRIIKTAEKRSCYKGLCNHTGVVKYIREYRDETTYYLQLSDRVNPAQEHGWFVYDEKDLAHNHYLRIDEPRTIVTGTTYHVGDFETVMNKIKEEKKEMELLEIYFNEKIKQLEIEHDKKRDKIKTKDPIIKELGALAKKYKDVKGLSIFPNCEYQFSKEILEELNKCDKDYRIQREKLSSLENEIKAQLDICETYEQKMNVLKVYGVVDEQGKLNK